jgi:hypothetical protein
MSKRKGHKKEVVRIDVDWLLGESPTQSVRTFPRFGSVFFALLCVLAVVWSWPYASKQWLQWEWQKQLVESTGKPTEDILPILLALNDLNPGDNLTLIRQLADSDPNKRKFSFQILEKRIQQWGQSTGPTHAQWLAMVEAFQADEVQLPESIMLRGLLAQRMRPLVPSDLPDAPKVLASFDAMVDLITPRDLTTRAVAIASAPIETAIVGASQSSVAPVLTSAPSVTAKTKISDSSSSELASNEPASTDPPSLSQYPTSFKQSDSVSNQSAKIEPNRQTLRDQSTSATIPPLPNMNLSIPQTVAKAATPMATVELVEAPSTDNPPYRSQESNAISGIEKLSLEQLLPLLTSRQSRLVQQAFNELVRRGMTPSQLDVAVSLAHGDAEERLRAMESIAKDSNFPYPITWLVWMAENADRNVRRRAVVLLGSMTDSDARRKLRILQYRESDSAIADLISQVLLASGTASISVR